MATVYNLGTRYRQEGLVGAIGEKARPGQPKVTPQVEADIPAIACGQAPMGWCAGPSI